MSDSGGRVEAPALSNLNASSLPCDIPRPPAETTDKEESVSHSKVDNNPSATMGNQQGSGKDSSSGNQECCLAKSPKRQRKEKEKPKKKNSPDNSPLPYYKYDKSRDVSLKQPDTTETNKTSLTNETESKSCEVDVSDFVIVDTRGVSGPTTEPPHRSPNSKPIPINVPSEKVNIATDKDTGKIDGKKEELSTSVDNSGPPPPSPSQLASFCEEDEEIENEDDYMEARSKEIIDDFGNSVCQRLSVLVDNDKESSVENTSVSESGDNIPIDSNKSTSTTSPVIKDSKNNSSVIKSGVDTRGNETCTVEDTFRKDSGKVAVLPNFFDNSSITIPESPTCRFVPDSPTLKFIPSAPTSTFVPEAPIVMRKTDTTSNNNAKMKSDTANLEKINKPNESRTGSISDHTPSTKPSSVDAKNIHRVVQSEVLNPNPEVVSDVIPSVNECHLDDKSHSFGVTKSLESISNTDKNRSNSEEHLSNITEAKLSDGDNSIKEVSPDLSTPLKGILDNNKNKPPTPDLCVTTEECISAQKKFFIGGNSATNDNEELSSTITESMMADSEIVEDVMEARASNNLLCAPLTRPLISHSISDEFNNNINFSKEQAPESLPVRPESIQNVKIMHKMHHKERNLDDLTDSNLSSGELSTPCNDSSPTAADIFAQTDSDSCLSAVESDKSNRLRTKSESTSCNEIRHSVNRPILEMPELEETSAELEELHVIFRKNPEKASDTSFPRQFSLRSPPEIGSVNGRRSRASDCLSRTESDLDLSEQRDDISTDGMFADDEDECEVLMCKTYTEPEQGAEVLLSCTIVNSAFKENHGDSFWSDHSLEDLRQTGKKDSPDTTPAFRDARQQMKDIHIHLQNLRVQMEQLNDDLVGEESYSSDEYLSFSDTKRPITN